MMTAAGDPEVGLDAGAAAEKDNPYLGGAGSAGMTEDNISGYVKLRGLPFDANAGSICEFFEGQVEEWQIHFVQDMKSSKPHCGEAVVD